MPEVAGHDSKSNNLCHAITRLQTGFLMLFLCSLPLLCPCPFNVSFINIIMLEHYHEHSEKGCHLSNHKRCDMSA